MTSAKGHDDRVSRAIDEVRASPFARRGLWAALIILLLGQWYQRIDGWSSIPSSDVRVYAQGGRWALKRWDVYSSAFSSEYTDYLPFSYPPFGAIVMVPLGLLPDPVIFPLWTVVSLICLAGVISLSFRCALIRVTAARSRTALVAVGVLLVIPTGPVSELLPFGQIGAILTLACLTDVLGRTGRVPQGVLVGIMSAVKLTPGLFIIHWLVNRQWRAAGTAVATVAACWTIGALWLPSSTATYLWGERLIVNPTARAARPDLEYNQSIGGVLARINEGYIPMTAYLILAVAVGMVGLAIGVLAVRAQAPLTAAAVIGLTSVLITPVSWTHHALWLIPALGAVLGDATTRWRVAMSVALIAAIYYPTRGWMPLEASLNFREVWVTIYCGTIVLLASILRRSLTGRERAS